MTLDAYHIWALVGILSVAVCRVGGAEEWEGVCWSPHSVYFNDRDKALALAYSWANVNAVRATYFVGKPAYVAITKVDDVAFDVVTGLGGGPGGVVASVVVNQGVDAAMALLGKVVETPQYLATEMGARTMEKGIKALNDNYRVYRRGMARLDASAKTRFRQNQVYVDLMGPAKNLYLAARDDDSTHGQDKEVLDILASIEQMLGGGGVVGGVFELAEVAEIVQESGLGLEDYGPYARYRDSLDAVLRLNGVIRCPEVREQLGKAERAKVDTASPTRRTRQEYVPMTICEGGSIDACRRHCYVTCDFDKDNAIRGGWPEGRCYTDCNRDCDRHCLTDDSSGRAQVPSVEAYVGGSIKLHAIFAASSRKALGEAGLVVVLPDGSPVSCMNGVTGESTGCTGRIWSANGYIANDIAIRGFKDPGSYLIYFDASQSSSSVSLENGNALVERWARGDSFVGYRGVELRFDEGKLAPGEATLVGKVVVSRVRTSLPP